MPHTLAPGSQVAVEVACSRSQLVVAPPAAGEPAAEQERAVAWGSPVAVRKGWWQVAAAGCRRGSRPVAGEARLSRWHRCFLEGYSECRSEAARSCGNATELVAAFTAQQRRFAFQ